MPITVCYNPYINGQYNPLHIYIYIQKITMQVFFHYSPGYWFDFYLWFPLFGFTKWLLSVAPIDRLLLHGHVWPPHAADVDPTNPVEHWEERRLWAVLVEMAWNGLKWVVPWEPTLSSLIRRLKRFIFPRVFRPSKAMVWRSKHHPRNSFLKVRASISLVEL